MQSTLLHFLMNILCTSFTIAIWRQILFHLFPKQLDYVSFKGYPQLLVAFYKNDHSHKQAS